MNDSYDNNIELPLKWISHPALETPAKGVLAIVVIIIAAFGAAILMESIFWGMFSFLVLFLGLIRFFIPTEYSIDSAGIREKFLGVSRIASWRIFKRAFISGRDVLLSPYSKRTFIERFRAWQVHTPNPDAARFIAEIIRTRNSPNTNDK